MVEKRRRRPRLAVEITVALGLSWILVIMESMYVMTGREAQVRPRSGRTGHDLAPMWRESLRHS